MARTKISEFSATAASNTDIDSINLAEGCAPSGINDAIRELMAQLKDFQTGAVGDSFNGPVGTTTAAAGAFTTLSASSTVTLSGGTANGVTYLNGSKVLTSGSALTFDGTTFKVQNNNTVSPVFQIQSYASVGTAIANITYDQGTDIYKLSNPSTYSGSGIDFGTGASSTTRYHIDTSGVHVWTVASEGMRLTSTGLGIGTSSPAHKLDVNGAIGIGGTKFFSKITGDSYIWNNTSALNFVSSDGNTVQMKLDSSGNLGLGVTPYSYNSGKAFDIGSTGAVYNDSAKSTFYYNNVYNNSGYKYKTTGGIATAYLQDVSSGHVWLTAPSGTAGNAITFTQALTLDASGNLLCGTTSLGTSYGAGSGVVKQTGGVWTDRGQFSATGGSTTTFLTLANASNNQSYIVSVRQSGNGANFVSAFVIAYSGSCSAIRFVQDNTNPILDMNITVSGLGLRLVLGSGFGSTTWDWVITRLG